MKKLLLGLTLLVSFSSIAQRATIHVPVIGFDSVKYGVRVSQARAQGSMETSCHTQNGEIIRFICTENNTSHSNTIACSGVCRVDFENEIDMK